MISSPLMTEFIEEVESRFLEVKPAKPLRLALRMKGHGQLTIEEILPDVNARVAVMLDAKEKNPIYSPEIFFWLKDNMWASYAIHYSLVGWRGYGQLNPITKQMEYVDVAGQQELAEEVDHLVNHWWNQGWLSASRLIEPSSQMSESPKPPEPTGPQPDTTIFESSLDDNGECEATSVCSVEAEGIRMYGRSSWLLALAVI